MGEHTPGPYTLTDEFSDAHYYMTVIAADGDTIVADVVNQHVLGPRTEFGGGWLVDDGTSAANARLIAAAPRLLAALEEIAFNTSTSVPLGAWPVHHYADSIRRCIAIATAAIAETRGERNGPQEDDE